MKKLEIELVKIFDTGLAMRVIHQDESLRNRVDTDSIPFSHKDMRLGSRKCPALHNKIVYLRGSVSQTDNDIAYNNYNSQSERDAMYDFINEAMEHINKPEPLTFERIRKECVPMKHLLIDEVGYKRLYLGFNRAGYLVTDHESGSSANDCCEYRVKNWTIEEYKEGGK